MGSTEDIKVLSQIKVGWQLLTVTEQRRAMWLVLFVFLSGLLDMAALAAIMPFLGLAVAPDEWAGKVVVADLLQLMGCRQPRDAVPLLGALVVTAIIGAALVNGCMRAAMNLFAARCRTRLVTDLAQACLEVPYSWHLQHNAAIVARQINMDVMRWGGDFVTRLLSSAQTLALVMLGSALILIVAPVSGILSMLLVAGLTGLANRSVVSRIAGYTRVERHMADVVAVSSLQLLAGIKDVKLSNHPYSFLKILQNSFSSVSDAQSKRNTIRQVLPTVMLAFGQIALVAVVLLLWTLNTESAIIAEQVAFLALVASRLVPAANRLFTDIGVLWDVYPFTRSLYDLKDSLQVASHRESVPTAEITEHLTWEKIQFDAVSYAYPNADRLSLQPTDLQLDRGKAYGVAGPSGAGKTTFVDLLLGLLQPTSGSIWVGDLPLEQIGSVEWQARLGYVSQNPFMSDDTLRANIAFGVPPEQVDEQLVLDCLHAANLGELLLNSPQGLATPMGDRGQCLSGGQRQRVAIARALYKKPDILVLDEATSALDSIAEDAIQVAISGLKGRVTTLTIAHRLSTIRSCDEILLFEAGRLQARGCYDVLVSTSQLFQRLVASTEKGCIRDS